MQPNHLGCDVSTYAAVCSQAGVSVPGVRVCLRAQLEGQGGHFWQKEQGNPKKVPRG